MHRVVVWAALVGSILGCVGLAVGCWLQTSVVGWVANLLALATILTLALAYERPGTRLVRAPFAWFYRLCGVAGLASVLRIRQLGWPHISSTAFGLIVFILVLMVYVVAGLREPGHPDAQALLSPPFASGHWAVTVGGVAALNHHLATASHLGALDLVAVRANGARAQGVCPARLEDYEAFGQEVVSPCEGVIVEVVDDSPDQLPQRGRDAPHAGNRLRIDSGREIVTLSHLRHESARVVVGDRVTTGQPVAQVGCSGRSVEPHLHIHAERDGRGLRLRFTDAPKRRLRPGAILHADSAARPI